MQKMANWSLHTATLDTPEWSDLLATTDHMLFHEPCWVEVIHRGLGGSPYCLLIEHNGEICGGLLVFEKRVLWARLLYAGYPYGGVLGTIPPSGVLADLISRFARARGLSRLRIADAPHASPTPTEGFKLHSTQTQILDLEMFSKDKLLNNLKPEIRRNLRRARRAGLTVESVCKAEDIEAFYGLYIESMQRNRTIPKLRIEFVTSVVDAVIRPGKGELLLARHEGTPIAGMLVVDSIQHRHYLMGGSSTSGLMHRPNDFLFWQAIESAITKGLRYFDFLPSGEGGRSLLTFKAKWGAVPVQANVLDLNLQPLRMSAWQIAYRLAKVPILRHILSTLRVG